MLKHAIEFLHGQPEEAPLLEKTVSLAKNAATLAVAALFTYEYGPQISRFVSERMNKDAQDG